MPEAFHIYVLLRFVCSVATFVNFILTPENTAYGMYVYLYL